MNETYQQFNDVLYRGIQPFSNPAISASTTPANERLTEGTTFTELGSLTGEGTLIVQVSLAKGAIPVQGATVLVTTVEENPAILANLVTDKSGQTERISLPAPGSIYSQTPGGNVRPYSIYNIKIQFPGYYTEEAINVPIFDKINSIQPVALIPLPENTAPSEEIVVDESNQGPV